MSDTLDNKPAGNLSNIATALLEKIQRLAKTSKYEAPKLVSVPMDGLRVTNSISMSGNL